MENSRRAPSRQFLAQPRGQISYHPLARTELADERMREAWEAFDGAPSQTHCLAQLEETYAQALASYEALLTYPAG